MQNKITRKRGKRKVYYRRRKVISNGISPHSRQEQQRMISGRCLRNKYQIQLEIINIYLDYLDF